LFQSILEEQVLHLGQCETAKEVWEAIKARNLGVDRVKEARLQTLIAELENLKLKDSTTTDYYENKLSGIAAKATTLGEPNEEKKRVKKFLTSLPQKFIHIVASIEQVLDLKTIGFGEVFGRLKAYDERIRDDENPADNQGNLLFSQKWF
jgi:hypothetical protein